MDVYDVAMLFILGIIITGCVFTIISRMIIIPRLEKKDADEARASASSLISPDGQPLQRRRKAGRSA
ncbi:MAG: hypothetical protein LBT40_17050 [Deltaproteobacteria bacterium]|nr:hypothetical protein [Deltaproteobacteria bacterium]